MSIKYKNFRGEDYFLHSRKTGKGNFTYYFSKKDTGDLVDQLPQGYEIYENPNGKVFLRKPLKKLIQDSELKIIENGVKNYCSIKDFKLDIKKEIVYIYTLTNPVESIDFSPYMATTLNLDKYKEYETVMRFRLVDEDTRTFMVDRYSFLGAVDDWIELEESDNLEKLVKEYLRHIGKESIYDLF